MNEERKKREGRSEKPKPEMTDQRFMATADKFIDLANRQNKTMNATDLHLVLLYAAARYSAHVAKNVLDVDEHEPFVEEMLKVYQEMLRNHLADPSL